MPLKTSSFNKGIYFSNLKRFWLIAFSYTFLLGLLAFSYLSSMSRFLEGMYDLNREKELASSLFSTGTSMMVLIGFFSLVSALAVFSYIHFQKNTAMVHALPVSRKSLFITNYLSGLTLIMVPLLISGAIILVGELLMGVRYLMYAPLWILTSVVVSFLLYSFAVFAGMFTGHMAAQAVFFIVFNLLASFLLSMVSTVFNSLLYGFSYQNYNVTTPFSPFIHIPDLYSGFAQNTGGLSTVIWYFVAGLIFTYAAYRIYRKRRMETAGDVISLKVMKPIFRYSFAFCSSILMATLIVPIFSVGRSFAAYILCFLFGGFIGYYAAEMLLKKTFRVFRKLGGFLGFSVIMILLLSSVYFDIFGYESYVPAAGDIEFMYVGNYYDRMATIAMDPKSYNPDKDRYMFYNPSSGDYPSYALTDTMINDLRRMEGVIENPDTINTALALHQYIADNASRLEDMVKRYAVQRIDVNSPNQVQYINLSIAYRLKSGRVVSRAYSLPYIENTRDELESYLTDLLSTPEVMGKFNPILNMNAEDLNFINIVCTNKINQPKVTTMTRDMSGFLTAYQQDVRDLNPLNALINLRKANPVSIEVTFNINADISQFTMPNGSSIGMQGEAWIIRINLMTDNKSTLDYLVKAGIITPGGYTEIESKY